MTTPIRVDGKPIDPKLVELHDGYITRIGDKDVPYKRVILRPQTVAMDAKAIELSERLIMINGMPTLKMSEEIYRIAMTMLRIERFECTDGNLDPIGHALIDLEMIGRLHPYDLIKIEQQVLVFDMVESLRFGNITQAQFDAMFNNTAPKEATAPQHEGEETGAGEMGQKPRRPRPIAGRLDSPTRNDAKS